MHKFDKIYNLIMEEAKAINNTNNNAEVKVQNLRKYPNRLRRKRKIDKEELSYNVMEWIDHYYQRKDEIIDDVYENNFYAGGYDYMMCNVVHKMDTNTLHISILDLSTKQEVILEFDVPVEAIKKPLYVIHDELKKLIDF